MGKEMNTNFKVVLAAAVCTAVLGSSPAYANLNQICVTFVNKSSNNVGFQAYDTQDSVMWTNLSPGLSNVGSNATQRLCFESVHKEVKVWYKSYSSKSINIKTSTSVTGTTASGAGGSASTAYDGPIDVKVNGAGQGLLGTFGTGACVFVGEIGEKCYHK